MSYDAVTDRLPDQVTDRLRGTVLPEYRMDADEIREHESLEALQDSYAAEGVELDDLEETYEKAKQDWWDDRRRSIGRTDETLPGDTIEISYEDDGEQVTGQIHVRGLVHGLHGIINPSERLEEATRQEIEQIAGPDRPVLLEQNFPDVLYQGIDQQPHVEEMDDHAVLTEHSLHPIYSELKDRLRDRAEAYQQDADADRSPDTDPRDGRLATAGELYKDVVRLSGRLSQQPETRKHAASMRALDDPGYLRDMQNATAAGDLPAHLKADRFRELFGAEREDQLAAVSEVLDGDMDTSEAVDTLYSDVIVPEATNRFRELWELIEIGRSEYMAQEAVEQLGEDGVEQVDLVVGAGHQAQIIDTIREAPDEQLRDWLS